MLRVREVEGGRGMRRGEEELGEGFVTGRREERGVQRGICGAGP